MDDFAMEGEILREALDKIAKINQLLGGNKLTLQGVQKLLLDSNKKTQITIVDVGCGNGDMLRKLAKFGNDNGYNFQLIGIDANNFTVNYAKKLSTACSNIQFRCEDIVNTTFSHLNYDIVLCTLTLHHFNNQEIENLLRTFNRNCTTGIIINDLHRSIIAYRLFEVLCFVFGLNKMSKQDGLTSILRGFKKLELVQLSEKMSFKNFNIQWKWAFRYQWIIKKDVEIIDG